MIHLPRKIRTSALSLLLSAIGALAAAGCAEDSGAPAGSGGLANGGTGGVATGGASQGTGGTQTGGVPGATGGLGQATGGSSIGGSSTGGSSTGGVPQAGGSSTGGANPQAGGAGSGGGSPATGGTSSGGTDPGTGGTAAGGAATGGAGPGTGGGGTGGGGSSDPVLHVFMLMGQSNMAGVADKQASDQNTDERLQVLGGCNQPDGQWNLANPPLNDCPGEKGWNLSTAVGPGMWFAKTIADSIPAGDSIGMVGTAESGESINTFISGGTHHQMILNKIATAKMTDNARLAGIIFHQGESDNTDPSWPGKVVQLYDEVKAAWGVDYDVPFILGELPNGGCCSAHNTRVHEAADQLPMGGWVTQEGTNVMDQYHFDHPSVVLMGTRYGEAMIEALGW